MMTSTCHDRWDVPNQVQMAVIQTHTCKTELSKAYHNAGVIHFLQSGTDMRDSDGSDYGNKNAWCVCCTAGGWLPID